ncbi:CRAL-TRIO domain-containing protein [Balamuthia mandrillaris]
MAFPALDEQQKAALEEMRKQFPEEEDSVLYRFLKARRFQPSDASKMLSVCLEWRKEMKVEEIDPKTLKKELAFRRIYFHKRSKSGRICCVMQPGRHNPKTSDRDLALRMIIYFLETACSMLQEPTDKFAVVADLSGVGYSNVDMPLSKEVLRILSDYYPERLGEAYFVNSPFIFKSIWNVLKVFLDEETRSKFKFVDGKKGELWSTLRRIACQSFWAGKANTFTNRTKMAMARLTSD